MADTPEKRRESGTSERGQPPKRARAGDRRTWNKEAADARGKRSKGDVKKPKWRSDLSKIGSKVLKVSDFRRGELAHTQVRHADTDDLNLDRQTSDRNVKDVVGPVQPADILVKSLSLTDADIAKALGLGRKPSASRRESPAARSKQSGAIRLDASRPLNSRTPETGPRDAKRRPSPKEVRKAHEPEPPQRVDLGLRDDATSASAVFKTLRKAIGDKRFDAFVKHPDSRLVAVINTGVFVTTLERQSEGGQARLGTTPFAAHGDTPATTLPPGLYERRGGSFVRLEDGKKFPVGKYGRRLGLEAAKGRYGVALPTPAETSTYRELLKGKRVVYWVAGDKGRMQEGEYRQKLSEAVLRAFENEFGSAAKEAWSDIKQNWHLLIASMAFGSVGQAVFGGSTAMDLGKAARIAGMATTNFEIDIAARMIAKEAVKYGITHIAGKLSSLAARGTGELLARHHAKRHGAPIEPGRFIDVSNLPKGAKPRPDEIPLYDRLSNPHRPEAPLQHVGGDPNRTQPLLSQPPRGPAPHGRPSTETAGDSQTITAHFKLGERPDTSYADWTHMHTFLGKTRAEQLRNGRTLQDVGWTDGTLADYVAGLRQRSSESNPSGTTAAVREHMRATSELYRRIESNYPGRAAQQVMKGLTQIDHYGPHAALRIMEVDRIIPGMLKANPERSDFYGRRRIRRIFAEADRVAEQFYRQVRRGMEQDGYHFMASGAARD